MSTYPVSRKPRAFGYLCLPAHAEPGTDRVGRQRISNFATVEGLSLLRIFVDDRESGGGQFSQMLSALDQHSVTHLIVPGHEHLNRGRREGDWMVQHILSSRLQLIVHTIDDQSAPGVSRTDSPELPGLDAERRSA